MRMRKELRDWIRTLQHHTAVTIILVTHDYKEALEIASDIVMLQKGRVEQHGKPEDFYNLFVERGLV